MSRLSETDKSWLNSVNPRILGIVNSLEEELREMKWLALGEVGTSSKTIWQVMTGIDAGGFGGPPSDWDDFKRCYLLIQEFPTWRAHLYELQSISDEWTRFVTVWGELERMFELYYQKGRYPDHEHFGAICRSVK